MFWFIFLYHGMTFAVPSEAGGSASAGPAGIVLMQQAKLCIEGVVLEPKFKIEEELHLFFREQIAWC